MARTDLASDSDPTSHQPNIDLSLELSREVIQRNPAIARDRVSHGLYCLKPDRELEFARGSVMLGWDLDGTQAITENRYHVWTFKRTAERFLGRSIPMEEWHKNFSSLGGHGYRFAAHRMLEILQGDPYYSVPHLTADLVYGQMMIIGADRIRSRKLLPREDAVSLLELGRNAGQHQAVATSTPKELAVAILSTIGTHPYFHHDSSVFGCQAPIANDPQKQLLKPNPWPYRETARLSRHNPSQVVAIEDTLSGVESAVRAGVGLVIARASRKSMMAELVDGISKRIGPLLETEGFIGQMVVVASSLFGFRPQKKS